MTRLFILLLVFAAACAPLAPGVVVTNAPASIGNCMPEKPSGGCP